MDRAQSESPLLPQQQPRMSGAHWKPRRSASAALRWGGPARGAACCWDPAQLLRALSTCEVDSACPVVIALLSALAPDPPVIRTLDTICFESKTNSFETTAECADRESHPLGGWWTSEIQGNLTGEATRGTGALLLPSEAAEAHSSD